MQYEHSSGTTNGRESFGSRLGLLASMIGVAVGLGNVWRFPYMVGKFGGASFVLVYLAAMLLLGIPALAAEWALGRHTRRGPVGAFEKAGLPGGKFLGRFFFVVVLAATAYYTNAVGWVLYYMIGGLARGVGLELVPSEVLPPGSGVAWKSLALQLVCTASVVLACVFVLLRGLRRGTELASKILMPLLVASLAVLIVRALTLPGAGSGLHWFVLKVEWDAMSPSVVLAALGQACFSLSLGGTFMVAYGSFLRPEHKLVSNAAWTSIGDLLAGLLAGLAIVPAVFALGFEPTSGPGLIFETLPQVFDRIPLGTLLSVVFFGSLFGAAYLSDVAAIEVLVTGLTDNTRLTRRQAIWGVAAAVFVLSIPPMINMRIFVPWDLTFGSGMQTLGALLAAVAVGWCLPREAVLGQLGGGSGAPGIRVLYWWIRYVVAGAIVAIGVWWIWTTF